MRMFVDARQNVYTMATIAIRYELQSLEEFIREHCLFQDGHDPGSTGRTKKWEQFTDAEIKKIRRNMTTQVLSISKPRHIELYIQHHQAGILHLSAALWNYANQTDSPKDQGWRTFYLKTQQRLMELLDFLKHYFETYFDWHQALPNFMLFGSLPAVFEGYLSTLPTTHVVGFQQLLRIIAEPWRLVAEGTHGSLSFHQQAYYALLSQTIAERLKDRPTEESFLQILMQLNYNDSRFLDYWRMELNATLEAIDDPDGQLQFLAAEIKKFKQIPLQKVTGFNPSNPGVVSYCRHWMEEEFDYLQSLNAESYAVKQSDKSMTSVSTPAIKIQTRLTVSQLGTLFQLLHRVRIINHKNQTAFLSFFATHFTTENKVPISPKSLRNAYYNLDSKATDPIKDLLYEMIKELRTIE